VWKQQIEMPRPGVGFARWPKRCIRLQMIYAQTPAALYLPTSPSAELRPLIVLARIWKRPDLKRYSQTRKRSAVIVRSLSPPPVTYKASRGEPFSFGGRS
jgi:hypothetical protein